MRRLVYSPYVQAFAKTDNGVIDLSPYIVGGSVNRKVNQVSTAQLTLRNPVQGESNNLFFTEYVGPNDTEPGPLLHPMDPIIILMTRVQNHPVQVFTGYIDKSPYLQLYPGLCTVEASCTLKRLLYTQWDAALPFVQYFLQQFGWIPDADTGMSANPSAEAKKLTAESGLLKGQFNDGSLGALLFAVLNVIGQWDASTIWIEALPPQIKTVILNLYYQIQAEVQQGEQLFEGLLQQILGSGTAFGSGSPTGNIANIGTIIPTMASIAKQNGIPPEFVIATWIAEGSVTDGKPNKSNAVGYFQFTSAHPYPNVTVNYPKDATDLGIATTAFCQAAADAAKNGRSDTSGTIGPNLNVNDGSQWELWAEVVQDPGAASYANRWGSCVSQAQQYITQYGKGTPATSTGNSLAPNSGQSGQASTNAKKSGTSPGGKSGKSAPGATSGNYLATIFPTGTKVTVERTDEGVDFAVSDGVPISAIGSGTVSVTTMTGFDHQPLMMVTLDAPIDGYSGWYVSEGIRPTVTSGHVSAGQQIAVTESHTTGIEMGWADPKTGWPVASTYYQEGQQTPDGIAFANTINVPVLATNQATQSITVSGTGASGTSAAGATSTGADATAAAFSTFINLPSVFTSAEALAFTGKRSFMADQPLFPFVEQLCQASLRNFMSMPNGNFFAFFPDYFGLYGRKYYWEIADIEVMNGRIDLTDDPLATHIAVVGDVTQLHGTIDVFDQLLTSGIFTIFDALATGYINGPDTLVDAKWQPPDPKSKQQALKFLQRYGARPYVDQVPMIRSAFFELFFAFQKFMILWSKQFETTFELTFMPELFPGGLVALPDHHLQLYVEEVSHNFDYTSGFTTTVNFSSPSKLDGNSRSNLSQGMARPAAMK